MGAMAAEDISEEEGLTEGQAVSILSLKSLLPCLC